MVFEFDTGVREALKNVKLREPEPDLFLPPADAFVTFVNEPGGLIAKPARGR